NAEIGDFTCGAGKNAVAAEIEPQTEKVAKLGLCEEKNVRWHRLRVHDKNPAGAQNPQPHGLLQSE
ncbi:MAG: hypothetical protein ABFD25_20125, partial [Clostridiaceae bacterium]